MEDIKCNPHNYVLDCEGQTYFYYHCTKCGHCFKKNYIEFND